MTVVANNAATAVPDLADGPAVPFSRPTLGDEEIAAVARAIRSGWVTQGPAVQAFERAVADYVGAAHAVAVSNGTVALHLALCLLDVGPGDEVIVPSLTFIATANAVRYRGATPVFADVDAGSLNLDPAFVEEVCSDRTKAILAVHQFGLPADLDRLQSVADAHGCALLEDAACALGSHYRGRRIGTHTALACFSFHPRKLITAGEGGMIVTSDPETAVRLCRLRNHGRDLTDLQRHSSDACRRESYLELGYNCRMSDVQAAIGLAQMGRLDEILYARRRIGQCYDAALAGHPYLSPTRWSHDAATNRQTYAVILDEHCPLSRTELLAALRARRIAALPGLACIHQEPCYADSCGHVHLPVSERLSERMVLLPIFAGMTDAQREHVVGAAYAAFGLGQPRIASTPAEHLS